MADGKRRYEHFEWGYGEENGPKHWHTIPGATKIDQPLWGQSPINIVSEDCGDDFHHYEADAQYDFRPKTAKCITNTGRTWRIDYSPPDRDDLHDWSYRDGTLRCHYSLCNIHMHWGESDLHGSEHYIDGQDFSAEIYTPHVHFVYFNQDYYDSYEEAKCEDGGLMIQAMHFKLGDPDPGIQKIVDLLKHIPYRDDCHQLDSFDPFDLMPNKTREDMYSIYHYYGSLCQPPCAESVTWIIYKQHRTISSEQLSCLRRLHSHPRGRHRQEHITDNRRVTSLAETFPLTVDKCRIDFSPEEQENDFFKKDHWEGPNHREVISSEARKPWIGDDSVYAGCYSDDKVVTVRVKELLKPRREDCSHFNCQFRDDNEVYENWESRYNK